MAIPSRVYVGVFVFGLIASIVTVTYTVLFLTGYQGETGFIGLRPPTTPAKQLFLALSSLFSVGFTIYAWRNLIHGARRDAQMRRQREELAKEQRRYKRQQREKREPPGYN